MGQVDPDDDTVWRWVIHHFRFDADRRERRRVVVAAYDDEREFRVELDRYSQRVRAEIAAGIRSAREHVSGSTRHPGYRAQHALAHMLRRVIEHGVDPRPLLDGDTKLPSNVVVFGLDEAGRPFSCGGEALDECGD